MNVSRCFISAIACLLAVATLAPVGETNAQEAEDGRAAKVVAVRGIVTLRHADGTEERLRMSSTISAGDIVETSDRGRIQICFEDGSIVSLGKNTTIEINAFKYQPDQSEGHLETTIRRGLFRVMGGAITDFAPGNFKTHTPTASIGVRGCYYLGRVTANSTRVALLGSGNIYLENPFGSVDLDSPGETAQADKGASPRLVDDPDFIPAILGATGVGGEDEDPNDEQDDQPQPEDDLDDGWQTPGESEDEEGDPGDQQDPNQEQEQEQTPQDDDAPPSTDPELGPRADDIRNEEQQRDQQLQESTPSPELWNGLATARDLRGNWFDTQSLNDFHVLFDAGADAPTGEGNLVAISKQYVPATPVTPSGNRAADSIDTPDASVFRLDFRVWGTTPNNTMHLQTQASATETGTDPAEFAQSSRDAPNRVDPDTASFAGGVGAAVPFSEGPAATADIPEYMSWGEWNVDLHPLNDPSDVREDALQGFWVLGRRTPDEVIEALINSPRNVVGIYRGPAVADRIHAGNTTRLHGSSDLTVEFAQRRFHGGFTFPADGTELQLDVEGAIGLLKGSRGQAGAQWLRGTVTNITDTQIGRGRSSPENSVVNAAFFGTNHPDAMGGTFRTESENVKYIGNFIGKKE